MPSIDFASAQYDNPEELLHIDSVNPSQEPLAMTNFDGTNTCYGNCVFQLLLGSNLLAHCIYFMLGPFIQKRGVMKALHDFIKATFTNQVIPFSWQQFMASWKQHHGCQEDAAEFLTHTLHALSEDEEVLCKQRPNEPEFKAVGKLGKIMKERRMTNDAQFSILHLLYKGRVVYSRNSRILQVEPFTVLLLPSSPDSINASLQSNLELYFVPKEADEPKPSLDFVPPVLFLQIHRSKYDPITCSFVKVY